MPKRSLLLLYLALALLSMPRLFWGETYYPGDILYSHSLWYDWEHSTRNYDLIDPIALYYSHDSLYNESLKQGRLLTWNPYSFCGHPIFADGKSGMLYPPKLLLHFIFSTTWAHDLLILSHLFACAVTMHVFLSALGLRESACTVGGCLWMLNGLQATWLESEYVALFSVWVPLAMVFLYRGLAQDRLRPVPLIGASFSLGILGFCGLVPFWAHFLLLSGVWTLYLCYRSRSWGKLFAGGAALLSAIPIAMVQLIPMFELVSRAQRQVRTLDFQIDCFQNFLVASPALLLSPDAVGNPTRGFALRAFSLRGDWVMLETTIFLGLASLLFLFLGLGCHRHPHSRFFAGSLITIFVVAATPLYWFPFHFLPGFSQTLSTRFVFVIVFLFCILCAFGAQILLELSPEEFSRLRRSFWLFCGFLFLLYLGLSIWSYQQPEIWGKFTDYLAESKLIRYPFKLESREATVQLVQDYYGAQSPVYWWVLGMALASCLCLAAPRLKDRRLLCLGLLFLSCFDLLRFSWDFNSTSSRDFLAKAPEAVSFMTSQPDQYRAMGIGTIRPNTTNPFHLRTIEGHNSIIPRKNVAYANALNADDPSALKVPFTTAVFPIRKLSSPLLHQASARYIVLPGTADLSNAGMRLAFRQKNGMSVWENHAAKPMVRVFADATPVNNFEDALQAIYRDPTGERLFIESQDPLGTLPTGQTTAKARVLQTRPGFWAISANGPGWLVLGEAFDPGWSAQIDGTPSPITPAQGLFQAVRIPTGTHRVEFSFFPKGFVTGAWISGLSILMLLGLLLGLKRRAIQELG